MANNGQTRIPEIIRENEKELLAEWAADQLKLIRRDLNEKEVREQCRNFSRMLRDALQSGTIDRVDGPAWTELRDMLAELSKKRSTQGFTPSETALFVFSFKSPLFNQLNKEYARDAEGLARETWAATQVIDNLGLWTIECFQKSRDAIMARQQEDMLELSTPVVKLWDGILALPIIGTLDSARSQVVMESLLQKIVETGSGIAIIDITGVPTVDTLTAQHLLKTVTAARLMGADCIISGIRPQIAQTIVHLGVDLNSITTKASLADAISFALKRLHLKIVEEHLVAPKLAN